MAVSPPSPVDLALFTHRFEALAREMGELLARTAVSTNVKERLDFSCAVLDADGRLVVNAPHIPVHLGALGLCVRWVAAALPLAEGDVAVTNHPAFGGSHLPDVTVITPVFHDGERLGYVASRAHHAEIGGIRPGSMPPGAGRLVEEGVVIPPTYLIRGGDERFGAIEALLTHPPAPQVGSRAPAENLADLAAAVAANRRGAAGLAALAAEHGAAAVARHMEALAGLAADSMAIALATLPAEPLRASGHLDDGTPLAVEWRRGEDGLSVIDFTGSGGVHPGNLNAPPAVTRSAVLYVLRLLLGRAARSASRSDGLDVSVDLPLNEGLLRPVDLRVPPGMLNPPFPDDPADCPAVVGGNVETSQRVVEVLVEALGLTAASQGTMNNTLFGNDRFGYYETVCGGAGAGEGFAGASAVHTHMTNTRITDPEVLEHRYPVRLERFAVRRGSGGSGRFPGGDGVGREIRFLEPVSVSLLTQHRTDGPRGLAGGGAGAPGRQRLHRVDGSAVELGSVDGVEAAAGDVLVLETPGGGGWGDPEPEAGEG